MTSSSVDSSEYTRNSSRKLEPVSIKLPMIRIENELIQTTSLKQETRKIFRKSLQSFKRPKQKLALKVHDLTDKIFKDLPQTLIKKLVISPKLTNKIMTSAESSLLHDKIEQKKRIEKRKLASWSRKQKPYTRIFNETESNLENYHEIDKRNLSLLARPISPWMYQGRSRHLSVFS